METLVYSISKGKNLGNMEKKHCNLLIFVSRLTLSVYIILHLCEGKANCIPNHTLRYITVIHFVIRTTIFRHCPIWIIYICNIYIYLSHIEILFTSFVLLLRGFIPRFTPLSKQCLICITRASREVRAQTFSRGRKVVCTSKDCIVWYWSVPKALVPWVFWLVQDAFQ